MVIRRRTTPGNQHWFLHGDSDGLCEFSSLDDYCPNVLFIFILFLTLNDKKENMLGIITRIQQFKINSMHT
jgi:hypothetical protein